MTTDTSIRGAIEHFVHIKGMALAPKWDDGLDDVDLDLGADDLGVLCGRLAWPAPEPLHARPRADQFPLLVYDRTFGWAVAEQWESDAMIRLSGLHLPLLEYQGDLAFFDVAFPDPLQQSGETPRAISIFWRAIMKRKSVLISATLATVVANIVTLGTSLYSMQLFDRVIPLGSFSTLWVLTVGVVVALIIDFILRTVRAIMIEREAAEIDAEVSEYFFARAQAVRLDARPPGIGTMAAQLRGLEQVRGVMSSGSLFLLSDLPFALFFIVVIGMIGGVVAIIPIISLPISLAMAFGLARMIRQGTDRAQVSSNRKNGLLVESLDAAESIKAGRGSWFMLARWNRLIREVHHYEDPVKQKSAAAATVFATMQQLAYVGIMAVGAIEVAAGNITSGALLACSIIAGRVNGPLIAMLPGLIVQWGYASSSLRALDGILKLPLDRTSGESSLRPGKMEGPMLLEKVRFVYPGAREGLDIARLEFRPGERVAVIGGVGSGKTTLIRIMAGIFNAQQGTAKIGGLDVTQIADDVLRQHIGYLPQEYRLINGTLRDNLMLGLAKPSDEAVMEAAKKTGLVQLIAAHPLGLDLPIQEGGRGLSGGQRSLVGLTRLLMANPRIWLLDEPTANLDQNSEVAVLGALDAALGPDQTMVIVTHRLQLLARVQRVILMGGGKVLIDGPTAEVIQKLQTKPTLPARPAGKLASPDTPPAAPPATGTFGR
jgi:ATP-binding cassette subfamily C protein LapB